MTAMSQVSRLDHARAAGFWFIFYIAAFAGGSWLAGSFAAPSSIHRLGLVIQLVAGMSAIPLAFSLFVVLKPISPEWALAAFAWRIGEGVLNGMSSILRFTRTELQPLKDGQSALAQADAIDALLKQGISAAFPVSVLFFAVGSWIFFRLILASRLLPVWLGWSGLVGSLLAGVLGLSYLIFPDVPVWLPALWAPLAVAEVVGGIYLIAGRANLDLIETATSKDQRS
jgi:hypothetical protein